MQRIVIISLLVLVIVSFAFARQTPEGSLEASSKSGTELGTCPLKHTKVRTDISGFLARVTVEQEFENSFNEAIEAVYVFPLSASGAVDSMKMTIGQRTIRGVMMKREDARKAYEAAKKDGKTASLLDQERPNVFTQSVANIQPGDRIVVEISYVETLKYDSGAYEFVFPMTVAPRYAPGTVPDEETTKPVFAVTRPGHDVEIEVNLNAGVPVGSITSTSHEIETMLLGANGGKITLRDQTTIPNKDFVLRYDVSGKEIEEAVQTHKGPDGAYFSLVLQPPDTFGYEDITPKEIVFVLDSSGSMSGFPIEKAKEAIRLSLDGLYPHDTFNIITFAGDTDVLFPEPVPATQANLELARDFLENEGAGGGTEMMKAIEAALKPTASLEHIRIVCFMTDGLVDNEREVIAAVKRFANARVFSFGIGESTNRFLLDEIAKAGRGESMFVSLGDDGSAAAQRLFERVRSPLLTDISIDWNGLPVTQVYPSRIGDLFSAKPVVVYGRYTRAASGTITLRGKSNGQIFERKIDVKLPASDPSNDVLATLWARTRIDDLWSSGMRYDGREEEWKPALTPAARAEIVRLGLKHSIMTEFTSFVAIDEQIRGNGQTKTVIVPAAAPVGIDKSQLLMSSQYSSINVSRSRGGGIGYGNGSGRGQGNGNGDGFGNGSTNMPKLVSGGVINGKALKLVKPAFPAAASAVRASGIVTVEITIDETGAVTSATAVAGHPLLRAAAVKAAMASKFGPSLIDGQPVIVRGAVNYNFVPESGGVTTDARPIDAARRLTVEEYREIVREAEEREAANRRTAAEAEERLRVARKLHFWVFALYERMKKKQVGPTLNESKFVRDGFARIQFRIASNRPKTLATIKELGFVSEGTERMFVSGRIPIERLGELVKLEAIELVLPFPFDN